MSAVTMPPWRTSASTFAVTSWKGSATRPLLCDGGVGRLHVHRAPAHSRPLEDIHPAVRLRPDRLRATARPGRRCLPDDAGVGPEPDADRLARMGLSARLRRPAV